MKLTKIAVENFGKLQNFMMEPTDGIHLFRQENGWGKTTLAVFLKAMLFGLPASTKRSLDENERKKYTPWQGGAFGGSLEFTSEKGRFRVERFFGAKESDDTFALYDLATNLPSDAYSERLGEELFGIDADGFERTCFLSRRLISEKAGKDSVAAKLGGLLDASDESESFEDATAALEKRRKYYQSGNNSLLSTLERTLSDANRELEQCRLSEEAMQAQAEQEKAALAERDAVRKTLSETREKLHLAGLMRERNVLIGQKEQMETELAEDRRALEAELAEFCGKLPTDVQFEEAKKDFEEKNRAMIALQTAASVSADGAELEKLRKTFPAGIPTEEEVNEAIAENRELAALAAKEKAEEATAGVSMEYDSALPEKIASAKRMLDEAEKCRSTLSDTAGGKPTVCRIFACLMFAATVGCVAATVAGTEPNLLVLLSGVGFLIVGICLLLRAARIRRTETKRQENEAKIESLLLPVKELFASLGQSEPKDLSAGLEMLSVRAKAAEQAHKALSETRRQIAERSSRLCRYLQQYDPELTPREDYGDVLFALQRAAGRKQMLESAQKAGVEQSEKAQEKIDFFKERLRAFLAEYCPASKTESAFFAGADGHRNEILRLEKAIRKKTEELSVFVAEKLPDTLPEGGEWDYDSIAAEEKALHGREEELQQKIARLRSSIDRLTADSDRIPDLEQRIAGLKEDETEARANTETILLTMEFLKKAKETMTSRYLGGMEESLSGYLRQLMGEDCAEAGMNTDFDIHLREMGKTRSMESFSRGWRDAVDLCLRLSLTDALCETTETPFLLLDDPFVNLDDRRYDAAMKLLDGLKERYQILYLKCRER